jgi:hypothetical protein
MSIFFPTKQGHVSPQWGHGQLHYCFINRPGLEFATGHCMSVWRTARRSPVLILAANEFMKQRSPDEVWNISSTNARSCASAPQYVFMAWYLVKHRDNFAFAFTFTLTA